MNLQTGNLLQGGKYTIVRCLGKGAFGMTYLAKGKLTVVGPLGNMEVTADVAIKEFFMSDFNTRGSDGSSVEGTRASMVQNYRRKFCREAENLSKMQHPGIVKVLEVFDENNTTYYVMEHIGGGSLDDYIRQKGCIAESEALGIVREICSALGYMHGNCMLHLDLKPKNIMRTDDGHVKLIDFGLSKQYNDNGEPESSTTLGLGTPGYAPIEQVNYKQDGSFPATLDIYALGATMFKMLIGMTPPNAFDILSDGFPVYLFVEKGISDNLSSCIAKAMAPVRKNRYQAVGDLMEDLFHEDTIVESAEEIYDKGLEAYNRMDYAEAVEQFEIAADGGDTDAKDMCEKTYLALLKEFFRKFRKKDNTEYKSNSQMNGHEYVDLGLSVKWATCNVGAEKPSDYGDYFAWGETTPKAEYTKANSVTYKRPMDDISGDPRYDAARANWGSTWRLPTQAEIEELIEKCIWEWTTQDGHNGYLVTGPNGKSIFLPAAGWHYYGSSLYRVGEYGYYWSSTYYYDTRYAYRLDFRSGYFGRNWDYRGYGHTVRPVSE